MTTTFGKHLRQRRVSRHFNQRTLADCVGIDTAYISQMENGRRPPPSDQVLYELVTALGDGELYWLADRLPSQLEVMCRDNLLLTELLILLSRRRLCEETYAHMIALAKEEVQ